jgi:hypothetical protein
MTVESNRKSDFLCPGLDKRPQDVTNKRNGSFS